MVFFQNHQNTGRRLDGIPQEIHHVVCFLDDILITTQPWNATGNDVVKWCLNSGKKILSKGWLGPGLCYSVRVGKQSKSMILSGFYGVEWILCVVRGLRPMTKKWGGSPIWSTMFRTDAWPLLHSLNEMLWIHIKWKWPSQWKQSFKKCWLGIFSQQLVGTLLADLTDNKPGMLYLHVCQPGITRFRAHAHKR